MQIVKATTNTITRPGDTTQYASGDLVANSTTAGSVTPFSVVIPGGRGFKLFRVSLLRSDPLVTSATFRVHFYNDSPTVANGDNAAWSSSSSGYQGYVDIAAPGTAFTNTGISSGVYVNNSVFAPMYIALDLDQTLYALLEARGTYTPTNAGTFQLELLGEAYI